MFVDKELDNLFSYHAPKDDQPQRYEKIRNAGKEFARVIEECCPETGDKAIAVLKIRESVMLANASIAINE